jgi:large subunit ribosomal protein L15
MTTQLNKLPSFEGATHRRKIVGRGRSSGHGKTSTRGHKGQKSRTGFRQRPGFESGHIPLYRRLPRRGFNNADFKMSYDEVNVGALEAKFKAGETVDISSLKAAGLVRGNSDKVKLLGAGEIKIAVTVKVDAASVSAIAKIEKAGGKVSVPAKVASVEKPDRAARKAAYLAKKAAGEKKA